MGYATLSNSPLSNYWLRNGERLRPWRKFVPRRRKTTGWIERVAVILALRQYPQGGRVTRVNKTTPPIPLSHQGRRGYMVGFGIVVSPAPPLWIANQNLIALARGFETPQ